MKKQTLKDHVKKRIKSSRLSFVVHTLFFSDSKFLRPFRFFIRMLLHLEIPARFFKQGLLLIHPYNIIIHPDTIIGMDVTIYHNVTTAKIWSGKKKGSPVIGDNVTIYPHSIILGSVNIGNNCVIGAGSVVTKSVPSGSVVAGNPARIIRKVTKEMLEEKYI